MEMGGPADAAAIKDIEGQAKKIKSSAEIAQVGAISANSDNQSADGAVCRSDRSGHR